MSKKITDKEIQETKDRLGIDTKEDLTAHLSFTKKDIKHDTKLLKLLEKTVEMSIEQPKCLTATIAYVRKSLGYSKRDLEVLTEIRRKWKKTA